jgi:hypothetical protein
MHKNVWLSSEQVDNHSIVNSDGLRVGRSGFDWRQRRKIFILLHSELRALGSIQPPIQ